LTVDEHAFRDALGQFATGVCVVTGIDAAGEAVGVTISSFTSLSLRPPLVLFCIDKGSTSVDAFAATDAFTVNILAEEQMAASELFATQYPDKFANAASYVGQNGCKVLSGCLAGLECTRTATHEGGDHLIVVGHVDVIHFGGPDAPLARFRGRYRKLGSDV
jgi:flavin reductase (DIM6/NTAB) family NADH-FMN oxidoreductase RutF